LAEAARLLPFLAFLPSGLCGCGGVVRKCRTTIKTQGLLSGRILLAMAISRDDPFYSARSRLQRAEEKISELDTTVWEYRDKHPPVLVCEPDEPDRRTKTYKFKFTAPFPDSWEHLPIEILEATRSALDQCAYAAASLSGNIRLKRTQFPISDTVENLQNLITGRKVCEDVPTEVVAVFIRLRPYKGGNSELWALNKLRNATHTRLVPIAVLGANIHIRHSKRSAGELIGLNPVFDRSKNELPFARSAIDGHHSFGAYPTFHIGFDQPEVTGRRHAIAFLTAAVNTVQDVVNRVELVSRRLGFVAIGVTDPR
jgi:hypothetical protein